MTNTFPLNKVLSRGSLGNCQFDKKSNNIYYLKSIEKSSYLYQQNLDSGLVIPIIKSSEVKNSIGYGGKAFSVQNDIVLYSGKNNRINKIDLESGENNPITPIYDGVAYPILSKNNNFFTFVIERNQHCEVLIGSLEKDLSPQDISNNPFFCFDPTFSDSTEWVAFQQWQSDQMPFFESEIMIVNIKETPGIFTSHTPSIKNIKLNKADSSFSYPLFSPDSTKLAYCSDKNGKRSLYLIDIDKKEEVMLPLNNGEIGTPSWVFGQTPYVFIDDYTIVGIVRNKLKDHLVKFNLDGSPAEELNLELTQINSLDFHPGRNEILISGNSYSTEEEVKLISLESKVFPTIVSAKTYFHSKSTMIEPKIISIQAKDYTLECILYEGITQNEKPPLLVSIHGGPTSDFSLQNDPKAQYYAYQGISYLQVNHRGSSGKGKKFQDSLKEQWGNFDAEDAYIAANYLVQKNRAQPDKVFITGGSAGGYTVLRSLQLYDSFWSGGICLFGISDQIQLAKEGHRFEQPYNDYLLGKLPENKNRWKERSPCYQTELIKKPLIIFHGTKDNVIPYIQMEEFFNQVKKHNKKVDFILFEEEGHGFRKPENIQIVLEKTVDMVLK